MRGLVVVATVMSTTSRMTSAGVRNLPRVSMMLFGRQASASAMRKKTTLNAPLAKVPSQPSSGVMAVSMDTAPVRGSA